jgi:acetyltransferase-like isoleucine patch superfamily enzyme
MGRHSYNPPDVIIYENETYEMKVRIGAFCSIAADVRFMPGGNHRTDTITSFPLRYMLGLPGALEDGMPWTKGDIVVGNDVWIARGARILGGVTIGDGAVVAAYSVVTRDVEPYSIVAGNPAHHRRYRFEPRQIAALQRIAWWDWDDDVVVARVEDLMSVDVDAFIKKWS